MSTYSFFLGSLTPPADKFRVPFVIGGEDSRLRISKLLS